MFCFLEWQYNYNVDIKYEYKFAPEWGLLHCATNKSSLGPDNICPASML